MQNHREEFKPASEAMDSIDQSEYASQQTGVSTLEQLRAALDKANIKSHVKFGVEKVLMKGGIVGDQISNLDEAEETYGKELGTKPQGALKLAVDGLAVLDPVVTMGIDRNSLGSKDRRMYDFAINKFQQAERLRQRVATDQPELPGKFVNEAIVSLTQSEKNSSPLIAHDAAAAEVEFKKRGGRLGALLNWKLPGVGDVYEPGNKRQGAIDTVLYAGSVEDVARARDQLTSWLSENLNYADNPQVQEVMDKLNKRINTQTREMATESEEISLAA